VLSEQPAEQRAAHGAKPGRYPEPGQRLDPFGWREDDLISAPEGIGHYT
jgi:hypothetical protein